MNAHFYLMAESFSNNAIFSTSEIEEKVKRLSEDVKLINKHKETNKLYTNYEDIYPQIFYLNFTVYDFICNPQELKAKGVDRDIINALQVILEKSVSTNITSKEVREELLNWNDKENCHGLIAFHYVSGIVDSLQVIYGIDGWYKFRRHFLSCYQIEQALFISECIKYFPKLFFHERNKTTVGVILHNCRRKIVYHLTALNDKFRNSQQQGLNRTQVLNQFTITAKLDAIASLEGDAARKTVLTFEFINEKKEPEKVCCEPHLKLCYNDFYPGDDSYSNDRRIYFHEGKSNIQEGKILIGHIGDHL